MNDDLLLNLTFWLTGAIIGGASILELLWTSFGVAALWRHMHNWHNAALDWKIIDEAEAQRLRTPEDAHEQRIVVKDRLVTERIRSYKQSVFVVMGVVGCLTPPSMNTGTRIYALVLGLGLLSVQLLLLYNSTYNARTRETLDTLARNKIKVIRTTSR
jgi:hypothetical protein